MSLAVAGITWSRQQADLAVMVSLETTTRVVRAAMTTDMMHDAIHAEVVSAALAIATGDTAAYEEAGKNLQAHTDLMLSSYTEAQAEVPSASARAVLQGGRTTVERYRALALSTYAALKSGGPVQSALVPFERAADDTEHVLEQVGDAIEQSAAQTSSQAHEDMSSGQQAVLAALGIGVALVLMMTPPLIVSVLSPLRQMLEAVTVLNTAEGDLSHRLPELNAEFADLSRQFNRFLDKISGVVAEVHLSASTIGTASSEIATGNMDLSTRTEGAAQDLQVTSSGVQHLTTAVGQTVDMATQAKDLATSATGVAERGNAVMVSMVSTMEEINEASRRIADIIGVIDGIAFQTNILALNAAVEAARAGEQGRGFAVVASEVRGLAQRSAAAAKEIKLLIGASVERVDSGFRLVKDAGATMHDIVSSVRKVDDLIGQISDAAMAQQAGFFAINQAVVALDKKTQENAALVEQQAAAAESLRHQTAQLNGCIQGFRLHQAA